MLDRQSKLNEEMPNFTNSAMPKEGGRMYTAAAVRLGNVVRGVLQNPQAVRAGVSDIFDTCVQRGISITSTGFDDR